MSLVKILAISVVTVFTLVYGCSASSPTTLNQAKHNLTTINNEEITANVNLIQIDVSHNQITEFNSSIFSNHRSLQVLILSYNELYNFPINVSFLISNSLERFECVSCGISIIYKETFSDLSKLKEVDLSNNHLTSVSSGAFEKSFLLRYLNFDSNRLKKIPVNLLNQSIVNVILTMNNNSNFDFEAKEVWLKSKKLIEFQCNYCGISAIYEETFSELPNIEKISLNANKISTITEKIFEKNVNIATLFLERNNITDFPSKVFTVIMKLKALCIDGNPLTLGTISEITKHYVEAKLRTNCTEEDSEKFFEKRAINQNSSFTTQDETASSTPPTNDTEIKLAKHIGISDAFIASYLLIILVAQAAVIAALIVYWFKIVLTEKFDEFDYSSNVLNDHDIYDVS